MPIRAFALLLPIVVASASAGQSDDPAPLAGPEVREVRPDLLEQGLTAGPMTGMSMGQSRQLPMRDLRRLLEAMAESTAPGHLRTTAAQRDAFRALTAEHQAALRAYRREHAETIESMRIAAGLAPVRLGDGDLSGDQRAARTAFYSFMRRGPTDAHLQTRIFAELTDEQRGHINAEIGRLIEEQARERRERRYADELAASPVDPSTFFDDDGTVNMDALPERLRRQMSEFEEPHRANRLRRIVERVSRIRLESGESEPMAERAAPGIDAVQVPKPD
ncbi:MAG: hypothetical protein AAFY46_03490 [Planctomycetota bacterium]